MRLNCLGTNLNPFNLIVNFTLFIDHRVDDVAQLIINFFSYFFHQDKVYTEKDYPLVYRYNKGEETEMNKLFKQISTTCHKNDISTFPETCKEPLVFTHLRGFTHCVRKRNNDSNTVYIQKDRFPANEILFGRIYKVLLGSLTQHTIPFTNETSELFALVKIDSSFISIQDIREESIFTKAKSSEVLLVKGTVCWVKEPNNTL